MLTNILGGFLDLLAPARCAACDAPMPQAKPFCAACEELLEPAESGGAFAFGGPLATAIHRFKYREHPELARPLARSLVPYVEVFLEAHPVDCIAAVPLASKRLRERGYNQSALLAQALARLLKVPFAAGVLERCRETSSQALLDAEQRRDNVRDAFVAREAARGQRWLLIDDVRTTGATLEAASHALMRAGAKRVQSFTLAVAPKDSSR
jgi:ComF family protein